MHIQIVTFKLHDLTEDEYGQACEQQFVPAFRNLPGLISKVWIRNPESNTFGGVYTWRDKAAMDAYKESELFRSILAHPLLRDLTSSDYAVMETPTRLTHGWTAAAA